jgi:hypothetical protein
MQKEPEMERLKVGDRVIQRGWKWNNNEMDRFGEVAECYSGVPSATQAGEPMVAVKWDGVETIQRGYLNRLGLLEREPLQIPTFQVSRVEAEKV